VLIVAQAAGLSTAISLGPKRGRDVGWQGMPPDELNHARPWRGLVHRDLKPSNIFLTAQVFPCFIDR
jgi:serine/threonine protein kinase